MNDEIDRNHRINEVESDAYSFLCNCLKFSRCRNGRFSQEMVSVVYWPVGFRLSIEMGLRLI